MARGRKNGCPTNIRDWLVYILDKAVTTGESWVRIFGLNSLTYSIDSETEDGSADADTWAEPYVTKRSGSLSLEGKPIVDMGTGEPDPGQEMLDAYAEQAGCDGDATLKFVDPYGHTIVGDYIVSSSERSADDTENGVSWDLELVGQPESLPYVQVQSVALKDGAAALTTLAMEVGDAPKVVTVAFTPDNASNTRFRVNVSGRRFVSISNVTENTFTITPMAAGTATVTVTTMNGGKSASVTVNVTQP